MLKLRPEAFCCFLLSCKDMSGTTWAVDINNDVAEIDCNHS